MSSLRVSHHTMVSVPAWIAPSELECAVMPSRPKVGEGLQSESASVFSALVESNFVEGENIKQLYC